MRHGDPTEAATTTRTAASSLLGSLAWGIVMDGFKPDRFGYLGATICLVGATGIMSPKGAGQESREVLPHSRREDGFRAIFDGPMARRWRGDGARIFRQLPQKGHRGLSTRDRGMRPDQRIHGP
jgi:hypothetical protein